MRRGCANAFCCYLCLCQSSSLWPALLSGSAVHSQAAFIPVAGAIAPACGFCTACTVLLHAVAEGVEPLLPTLHRHMLTGIWTKVCITACRVACCCHIIIPAAQLPDSASFCLCAHLITLQELAAATTFLWAAARLAGRTRPELFCGHISSCMAIPISKPGCIAGGRSI